MYGNYKLNICEDHGSYLIKDRTCFIYGELDDLRGEVNSLYDGEEWTVEPGEIHIKYKTIKSRLLKVMFKGE